MEEWIGEDHCISYVGIRADEPSREGYRANSKKTNITAVYPYREDGLGVNEVFDLLEKTVVFHLITVGKHVLVVSSVFTSVE